MAEVDPFPFFNENDEAYASAFDKVMEEIEERGTIGDVSIQQMSGNWRVYMAIRILLISWEGGR